MGTVCTEAEREGRALLQIRLRVNRYKRSSHHHHQQWATGQGMISGGTSRWHGAPCTTVCAAQPPDPEFLFLSLQDCSTSLPRVFYPLAIPLLMSPLHFPNPAPPYHLSPQETKH